MKLFVVLCLVAVAVAAPAQKVNYSQDNVQLVSSVNDYEEPGRYRYGFEQTDGQSQQQEGAVVNEGREDESIAVSGYYAWVGPDGVLYRVTYKADDNGFQPEIEQGPGGAVPSAVVASLLG
ncbi:hypothetical protein PYW07_015304 [Mythimna separata]|uniref:Uncharacterized protein n=1 Tax=Mythimna separata TaxID=271217 RepID=A0AAD8DYC2_MYTSE|nr:hypothetical protein PYW07_015304 [Mythimna separata]